MAKCSAFLTLSVVRDGEPAPYVRLIYTVSDTKPSTPSGTAETVPDGWGLEVPVRADKKIVWVSSGVVSVINGEYQYAEWSEPSRYTADATALSPIVQWKWGASDVIPPDEEESTVSVGDEAVLEVNGQAVTLSTNSTDWSSTIPDQPSDKPYLWKREWIYASEGVDAGWVYYCVTGKQGVEGSYNALGYTINGSSITFCGMDTDGKPTLASFRATLGGDVVLFQRKTFTISTDSNGEFHDRYFLVAYWESSEVGALALCYLTPVTETDSDGVASYRMKWVSQDGEEIATQSIDGKAYDPYVLADIRMVSGSATIKSVTLINPTTLKSYESDYFMTIMAQGNMDDVNTVAKALDIERVFERVAAMEAFINKLFANEITITNTLDSNGNISKYGSIHSSGYNKLDYKDNTKQGFYLESTGYAELNKAVLKDASIETNDNDGLPILTTSISNDEMSLALTETAEYWKRDDLLNGISYINPNNSSSLVEMTDTYTSYIRSGNMNGRLYFSLREGSSISDNSCTYEYEFTADYPITYIVFNLEFKYPYPSVYENDTGIYVNNTCVSDTTKTFEGIEIGYYVHIKSEAVSTIAAGATIKIKINITALANRLSDLVFPSFKSYMIFDYSTFSKIGVSENSTETGNCYTFIKKEVHEIRHITNHFFYDYVPKDYHFAIESNDSNNLIKYVLNKSDSRKAKIDFLNYNQSYNCENSSISYEGTTYQITSLNRKTPEILLINDSTKIDLNSLYPMSFSINILAGKAVLQTKSICPAQDNLYTLGTSSDRFKAIYAANYYPPGSFYISTDPTSPASFIGGVWIALKGDMSFWFVAHDDSTTAHLLNSAGEPDTVDAGLPNIYGSISGIMAGYDPYPTDGSLDGALYTPSIRSGNAWKTGSGSDEIMIVFDANKSNKIYSSANKTVRPPAYKVYAWWRKS